MDNIKTTAQIIDAYANELKAVDNKTLRLMSNLDVELCTMRVYMERLSYMLNTLSDDFFNERKPAEDILHEFDENRIFCGLAQGCAFDITDALTNATEFVKSYFAERRAKAQ